MNIGGNYSMRDKMKLILIFTTFLLITILMISGCLNDLNPRHPDILKGLVAHWTFDEDSGNIIGDSSPYGNNGTVYGATWTSGVVDGALEFDGIDDFVQIPDNSSPPPFHLAALGDGSISIWFKFDYVPLGNGIMPIFYYGATDPCENMPDAANQGVIIEVGHSPIHLGSKRIYFTIFADGCNFPSFCFDSRDSLNEGEWYHFVAVVGTYKNIGYNTGYLNGEEMTNRRYNFGNLGYSQFLVNAVKHEILWIGRGYWDADPYYFDGIIDDVRIYDRPLSTKEVHILYTLGEK
jgi:hypothetical protein